MKKTPPAMDAKLYLASDGETLEEDTLQIDQELLPVFGTHAARHIR